MKNYFNRPETNVYIKIDDVANNVVFVNNSTNVKSINIITDTGAYTTYVSESTDSTKWITTTEETFNSVVASINSLV